MGSASLLLYLATLGQLPPVGTAVLNDELRQPPAVAPNNRYERYQLESAPPATRSEEAPITVPSDTAPARYASPDLSTPATLPLKSTAPEEKEAAVPVTSNVDVAPPSLATQLLAEALAVPAENALPGRPLPLVDLLTFGLDRQQQLLATHAYWSLATALMRYHYRQQEHQFIDDVSQQVTDANPGEASAVRAALAAARARVHESELAAIAAQHELASLLAGAPGDALPLPVDVPHAGTYRTQFDLLFAGRPAPPEARKIDRTLPIRFREIDARAAAVQAAEDALEAGWDAWARDEAPLETVLDGLAVLQQQRTVLLSAVEHYNHDIAQYALGVAPLGLNEQELAAMLIRRRGAQGLQFVPQADRGIDQLDDAAQIERAGFESPGWTSPRQAIDVVPVPQASRQQGQPTLAEPRLLPSADSETAAPRSIQEYTEPSADKPGTPSNPFRNSSPVAPIELPEEDLLNQPAPASEGEPATQPATEGNESALHTSSAHAWVVAHAAPDAASTVDRRLYPALIDLRAAKRSQRLGVLLHWDRVQPDENAEPVTMEACLELVPVAARLDVIRAYWSAREMQARYQVAAQRCEQLDSLAPWALEQRTLPGGSLSMLRLHAARTSAEADRIAGEADLCVAEFELTRRLGRDLNAAWVRATNSPHAGGYELRYAEQPAAVQQLPEVRRLIEVIPSWHTVLQDQAAAVVASDVARADATADFEAQRRPIDATLAAIHRQFDETLAFLDSATHYNSAIADYVLTVLPPETPRPVVLMALLLSPSAESKATEGRVAS